MSRVRIPGIKEQIISFIETKTDEKIKTDGITHTCKLLKQVIIRLKNPEHKLLPISHAVDESTEETSQNAKGCFAPVGCSWSPCKTAARCHWNQKEWLGNQGSTAGSR
ncbi:hypothetical protein IRJ41_016448 [Triplophysa rosa]|uniref:Uncharacterized protein n=1 Tax=Triplophysa rosa TaxID=992332 RepID=A0A9W8C905_TRIRA|nr:hypothetical protein IRJ41_016448 [Triplophysa rosa]